ncbi:MAG TPA: DUF1178 family protein [Xanthobacteraceae bacterium]|nr:DUF1178 family protein [Xanthobacteraceae bacterium]
MIRYALNCDNGHAFESWFANSVAYDKQAKRKLVTCPVCGSAKVEKAIMAPSLGQSLGQSLAPSPNSSEAAEPRPPSPTPTPPNPAPPPPLQPGPMPPIPPKTPVAMMSSAERELRHKLKELRDHITKNASYVGPRFPEEARKIHYGEAEHRSIYGEASPEEAKELHEEGIEFHPLPVLPDDKN